MNTQLRRPLDVQHYDDEGSWDLIAEEAGDEQQPLVVPRVR